MNFQYNKKILLIIIPFGIYTFVKTLLFIDRVIQLFSINKIFEVIGVVTIIVLFFFFSYKLICEGINLLKQLIENRNIQLQIEREINLLNEEIQEVQMKRIALRKHSEIVQHKFNKIEIVDPAVRRATLKNIFVWEKQIEIYSTAVYFFKSKIRELISIDKQIDLLETIKETSTILGDSSTDFENISELRHQVRFKIKFDFRSKIKELVHYVEHPDRITDAKLVLNELKAFSKDKTLDLEMDDSEPPDEMFLALEKLEEQLSELQKIER